MGNFFGWIPVSSKTYVPGNEIVSSLRACRRISLTHYARFCHWLLSQLARPSRHEITWIAHTFDSKSTWWIGCLPGSGQTCLLPPLALQIKPPFLSSPSLLFLFPIFSLIACSHVVKNRLWHFVTWQSSKIMLRLHHPASAPIAGRPSGACKRSRWMACLYMCWGHACIPAYVNKCLSGARLYLLSRYIIRMRGAQSDCVWWPLDSPQVDNTWHWFISANYLPHL